MTTTAVTVALAAALALAAGGTSPAAASPPVASSAAVSWGTFQTPSRNIRCGYFSKQLRCDVLHTTNRLPKRPKSCAFDYGSSFGLKRTGRAFRRCVSDAVDRGRVLRYGRTWKRGGITCRSRRTGLTCRNVSRHGFFLSRGAQRLL